MKVFRYLFRVKAHLKGGQRRTKMLFFALRGPWQSIVLKSVELWF